MDFWYVLIGAVAFVAFFPYIRCFFKRLKCAGKIKRLCQSKGYKIHATHPLWFLGSKHAKECDLYIETANEVFAIKLFGMPRRLSILVLKENREYFIRSFIALHVKHEHTILIIRKQLASTLHKKLRSLSVNYIKLDILRTG